MWLYLLNIPVPVKKHTRELTNAGQLTSWCLGLLMSSRSAHSNVFSTRKVWNTSCTRTHSRFFHSLSSNSTSAWNREVGKRPWVQGKTEEIHEKAYLYMTQRPSQVSSYIVCFTITVSVHPNKHDQIPQSDRQEARKNVNSKARQPVSTSSSVFYPASEMGLFVYLL